MRSEKKHGDALPLSGSPVRAIAWLGCGLLLVAACAKCGAPAAKPGDVTAEPATGQTLVPQLVVGLAFPGRDTAPHEGLSLSEALALRAEIENDAKESPRDEGSRGWFFHGFDDRTLSFFVGRFHVRCEILGCQDYVVERIVDVPRSADAMRQFDVDRTVALYEVGVSGVRGGMTPEEVKQVLGPPTSTMPEQYFGSFRWRYDDGTMILFWSNVVAGIEAR